MKKNWKDKLKDMGIEAKPVRRVDGSVIDGWFTFEYKGIPVFSWISINHTRDFEVGNPPFPPYADEYKNEIKGRYVCTDFDHFIENIEDFVAGTEGNNRMTEMFQRKDNVKVE